MRNTFRYSFATALTAGLVLAPFSSAFADTTTDGSGGVGSGNQIVVPVDVEANLCGNSLAVLGISKAKCTKVTEVLYESSGQGQDTTTDGSGGVASGNQIVVPVDAAIDACGNSVAVAGISEAECVEVVEVLEKEADDAPSTYTDGSGGVASGNQLVVPVDAAIEICGNSVAVLGASSAECTTIINIIHASPDNQAETTTDGSGGVASGNQAVVPVDAAVQICGNAVSVLGIAEASCVEKISDETETPEEPEDPKDPEEPKDPKEPKDPEESDKPEEPKQPEESDKPEEPKQPEDKPAPKEQAGEDLAVTGGALGGLIAAALAAVGAGGAGLYFARKRKVAAAAADE